VRRGSISRAAELKPSLKGFSTCFFFKDGTLPCLRRERGEEGRDKGGGNREGTTFMLMKERWRERL